MRKIMDALMNPNFIFGYPFLADRISGEEIPYRDSEVPVYECRNDALLLVASAILARAVVVD